MWTYEVLSFKKLRKPRFLKTQFHSPAPNRLMTAMAVRICTLQPINVHTLCAFGAGQPLSDRSKKKELCTGILNKYYLDVQQNVMSLQKNKFETNTA